jgi:hypothetical protein
MIWVADWPACDDLGGRLAPAMICVADWPACDGLGGRLAPAMICVADWPACDGLRGGLAGLRWFAWRTGRPAMVCVADWPRRTFHARVERYTRVERRSARGTFYVEQ